MKNFETIIGLEVHCVLNTKTKIFSSSKNDHNSKPNTNINYYDLALPGTLPRLNKEAVKKAIWFSNFTNMEIDYKNIRFDRKNYFYIDLARGFQITQQWHPIGKNGFIQLDNDKKIYIERTHLEEDTAKQFSKDNKIYLDYNRAGSGLIEIVTTPCISSAAEAKEYLTKLRQILLFGNISDAKMEDGSLRVDVNISIRPYGQKEFGTKIEIKNINSILNVEKAIEFETNRQISMYLNEEEFIQETRRFNDSTDTTEHMRFKTDAVNYRYIYEPNIINISLDDKTFKQFLKESPKTIKEIEADLLNTNLDEKSIEHILRDYDLYKLFNELNKNEDPLLIYKWISQDIIANLKKEKKNLSDLTSFNKEQILLMLDLLSKEEINGKQAKLILTEHINTNAKVKDIIKENNFIQIKDEKIIQEHLEKIISENKNMLEQYDDRPERVEKFFLGKLMQITKGQCNPNISSKILKNLLK